MCQNCILRNHPIVYPQLQGNPTLIVGEAPTQDDVDQGKPFTGRAGRELNTAMAGRRADLTHAVLCAPGAAHDALRKIRLKASKTNQGDPVQCCRPRLLAEVATHPSIILLGKVAVEAVTRSKDSILDKRGFAWEQK
jgi:DNA polymerase